MEEVQTSRRATRVPFAAELRATDSNTGSDVWGQTTNLSEDGCYVRTSRVFPRGTLLVIEIKNRGVRFQTDARVAHALQYVGMGLSFLNVPAGQLSVLEDWLSAIREQRPQVHGAKLNGSG